MNEPLVRDHVPLPKGYKTTTEKRGDISITKTIKKLEGYRSSLAREHGTDDGKEIFEEKCGGFLRWLSEASEGEAKTVHIVGEGNSANTWDLYIVAVKVRGIVRRFEVHKNCITNIRRTHPTQVRFEPVPYRL